MYYNLVLTHKTKINSVFCVLVFTQQCLSLHLSWGTSVKMVMNDRLIFIKGVSKGVLLKDSNINKNSEMFVSGISNEGG